jgi:dTDP-glucose 4,6-dehydratase
VATDIVELMCPNENECVVHIGDRPGQVMRHTADISKIESVLGWRPKTDWTQGLTKTIEWYEDNVEWWKKQRWMREIPIITATGKRELH